MKPLRFAFLACFACAWLLSSAPANAAPKAKDSDCLACHSDKSLTRDINGKAASLYVDGAQLKHSIHGSMFACVDCHTDIKGPVHESTPKKITCESCHADQQQAWQDAGRDSQMETTLITELLQRVQGLKEVTTQPAASMP